MALKGLLVTDDGVEHQDAYARIVEANLNWADERSRITINVYHDQAAREAGKVPIKQFSYSFSKAIEEVINEEGQAISQAIPSFEEMFSVDKLSIEGVNIIALMYGYFKTLNEWASWQDNV